MKDNSGFGIIEIIIIAIVIIGLLIIFKPLLIEIAEKWSETTNCVADMAEKLVIQTKFRKTQGEGMALKNYDPNIKTGKHTVEITLQQWEYAGHLRFDVYGNCKGKDVFNTAFDFTVIDSDCEFEFDDDYNLFYAKLKDENGDILMVDGDEDDFNRMIVKLEIVDYQEDQGDAANI